jgi:hypothetical protein
MVTYSPTALLQHSAAVLLPLPALPNSALFSGTLKFRVRGDAVFFNASFVLYKKAIPGLVET